MSKPDQSHAERLAEIKEKLASAKPTLLFARAWGKEHAAMEYMIERIEVLERAVKEAMIHLNSIRSGLTTDINRVEYLTKQLAHEAYIELQVAMSKA